MAVPTVTVTINLERMTGTAIEGAVVTATMDKNDRYSGGNVVAVTATATTDEDGVATLDLFPNALETDDPAGLGLDGSVYHFICRPSGGKKLDVYAVVPNADCDLHDIVVTDEVTRTPVASRIYRSNTIAGFDATDLVDGATVLFRGRDTVEDGGGGSFTYSASSTNTADGGTVFAPTGGGRLLREGWTALGFNGRVNVLWFGAKGDWTGASEDATDDTDAIQAAVDSVWRTSNEVTGPARTFKLVPATLQDWEGTSGGEGQILTALTIRSNTHFAFDKGGCLKIADDVSTDDDPVRMAMFFTNGQLSNVRWLGLRMDMNGDNNPISPNRMVVRTGTVSTTGGLTAVVGVGTSFVADVVVGIGITSHITIGGVLYTVASVTDNTHLTLSSAAASTLSGVAYSAGTYNRYQQAQIHVSGTIGGVAARIDDGVVDDCELVNNPGVTCIGLMQSNTVGVTLGRDWRISNSVFENVGLDTDDHSCIFGWSDVVTYTGNKFRNPNPKTGPTGGNVACELHGAHQFFHYNDVVNFYQITWIASNLTSPAEYISVFKNTGKGIAGVAFDTFRFSDDETAIRHVKIDDNEVEIDDTNVLTDLKGVIQIACTHGVSDFSARGNQAWKTGSTEPAAFLLIGAPTESGHVHDRITVEHNESKGFVFGAYMVTNATNGLGHIEYNDNKHFDLTGAGAFPLAMGVTTGGVQPIAYLSHCRNTTADTRASPVTQYGAYLTGVITTLHSEGNKYRGLVNDYVESGLTVTNRKGRFKLAFTPVFSSGSAITVGSGGSVNGHVVIDDEMVTIFARMKLGGAGRVLPGGALTIALPYLSANANTEYLGSWRIVDASGSVFRSTGPVEIDGTSGLASLQVDNGTYATDASPVPLDVNDVVSVQISYLRS